MTEKIECPRPEVDSGAVGNATETSIVGYYSSVGDIKTCVTLNGFQREIREQFENRILSALKGGPLTHRELMKAARISDGGLRRYLKRMRAAGVVDYIQKDGIKRSCRHWFIVGDTK